MNDETIAKFVSCATYDVLPGGQNESIRAGHLVIKPVHEERKYLWLAECLNQIDFGDLRVAIPVKSKQGNFVEDSVGATKYYQAEFLTDRIEAKLDICRRLNIKISTIKKPPDFDSWESPWTKAQNIAWLNVKNHDINIPREIKELIALRTEITLPYQMVHVDLAGNILFDAEGNPVVIDFTPGFYPREYAEALLLADSIAWYGASMGNLNLINLRDDWKRQLVLRAIIFRLSVPLYLDTNNHGENYKRNFSGYKPIIEMVMRGSYD